MSQAGGRPIIYLARFPQGEDLKDGYWQRVAAIDGLLAGLPRIFLRHDGSIKQLQPQTVEVADGAVEARISARNPLHRAWAVRLARSASAVYAHSIYSVEAPVADAIYRAAPRRILDLHGAVPEELRMLGEPDRAAKMDGLEAKISALADLKIGVTQRLLDHVTAKHGLPAGPSDLVLPILSPMAEVERPLDRKGVIYAGGFQPWQQLEKMAAFVQSHPADPATFLSPDPERMRGIIGAVARHATAKPEELGAWYTAHRFGLVLRQQSIVNQVASPTKLSEYLMHGLVPIVDSPDIGDFPALDYRWASWDSPLPSPEACREMVEANDAVLARIKSGSQEAAARLRAFVAGER